MDQKKRDEYGRNNNENDDEDDHIDVSEKKKSAAQQRIRSQRVMQKRSQTISREGRDQEDDHTKEQRRNARNLQKRRCSITCMHVGARTNEPSVTSYWMTPMKPRNDEATELKGEELEAYYT